MVIMIGYGLVIMPPDSTQRRPILKAPTFQHNYWSKIMIDLSTIRIQDRKSKLSSQRTNYPHKPSPSLWRSEKEIIASQSLKNVFYSLYARVVERGLRIGKIYDEYHLHARCEQPTEKIKW